MQTVTDLWRARLDRAARRNRAARLGVVLATLILLYIFLQVTK